MENKLSAMLGVDYFDFNGFKAIEVSKIPDAFVRLHEITEAAQDKDGNMYASNGRIIFRISKTGKVSYKGIGRQYIWTPLR